MRFRPAIALCALTALLVGCPAAPPDDDLPPVPDPSPPGSCQLAIVPPAPGSHEDFMVQVVQQPTDPDGDLVGVQIRWTVDGLARPDLDGLLAITADRTTRDEVWEATGVAFDETGLEGPSASARATVGNAPPGPPTLLLSPPEPVGGEDALVCIIQSPSVDPDGDEVTLDFAWQVNGDPYPAEEDTGPTTTMQAGDTVPRDDTGPSQTWTCTVTPADAFGEGEPAVASVSTQLPPPLDDWSLEDVNASSSTGGQQVSPRDYLERVTGWAFLHST